MLREPSRFSSNFISVAMLSLLYIASLPSPPSFIISCGDVALATRSLAPHSRLFRRSGRARRETTPRGRPNSKYSPVYGLAYWPPLYAYIRRRGYPVPEAQDLTQDFFKKLVEKNYLKDANHTRGKFRTFLLASLNHFLANGRDRARTRKRGRGVTIIPIEMGSAEIQYCQHAADTL